MRKRIGRVPKRIFVISTGFILVCLLCTFFARGNYAQEKELLVIHSQKAYLDICKDISSSCSQIQEQENTEEDEQTDSQVEGLSIIKEEYVCVDESNDIKIFYPQIRGLGDQEKEDRINALIESDVKKIIQKEPVYQGAYLDYEIKFQNEKIISIFYEGVYGYVSTGYRFYPNLYPIGIATTIDIENGKIVTLNDIITDFGILSELLLNDKFDYITEWKGVSGLYSMSWEYKGIEEQLEERLQNTEFDFLTHYIEWYTDGEHLIIVSLMSGVYNEYSIRLDSVKDILNEDFMKKLDFQWIQSTDSLSFAFEKCEYKYSDEDYRVDFSYPQMVRSNDADKERRINQLIEDDIKKVMEWGDPDNPLLYDAGVRRYEIKYADEKLISIAYYGWAGYSSPGRGYQWTMMTTTIDVQKEEVIDLQDVVSDFDGLCQMLMEDRFENITTWGGIPGQYTISDSYKSVGADDLLRDLKGEDQYLEWYIEKNHFVIVDLYYVTYNEYSIEAEQLREILQDEFLEIWGK